jgi:hypothetical protein
MTPTSFFWGRRERSDFTRRKKTRDSFICRPARALRLRSKVLGKLLW